MAGNLLTLDFGTEPNSLEMHPSGGYIGSLLFPLLT